MGLRDRIRNYLNFGFSISDPGFADLIHFGMGPAGSYFEAAGMENPAYYRAVSTVTSTIAALPLKTYRTDPDTDERIPQPSFIDTNPSGPFGLTPFNWKEQIALHLVLAGEVGLPHIHDEKTGQLIGLIPTAPSTYGVRWVKQGDGYTRVFKLSTLDGKQKDYGDGCANAIEGRCMTYILGPTLNGLRGLNPTYLFRRSLSLSRALDDASMRSMISGSHISGLVSAKDPSVSAEEAEAIAKNIREKMSGPEHAGEFVVTNAAVEFTPWTMTMAQAQYQESREFQVAETARMLGTPANLLYATNKDQSFASGLAEQTAGFAKFTLMGLTSRIEEAISSTLPSTRFVEFNYKQLLQPTPVDEIKLLLQQLEAGVLSEEEFREFAGLGPKEPGDTFRTPEPAGPTGRMPLEPAVAKAPQVETDTKTPGGNMNGAKPAGMMR